jgi:adenosylcobyric acid synthase
VAVAPFKAQNMSNNSVVTTDGGEIGRAQAMQALACGLAPSVAFNPVLLKPGSDRTSQVVVRGRVDGTVSARSYQERKAALLDVVTAELAGLRERFDVVVCEGAGSPAEINLRANDIANMGLAQAADLPVVVVGDIDRGGVFASLLGTLALLDAADQAHVAGFLINRFRGDASLLAPGVTRIEELTGRPVLGVLPYLEDAWLDVEDSLALEARRTERPAAADTVDVAVLRLRWMSNFTDADALAAEPGVRVRFTRSIADVERADLVVVPGTKATVEDLDRLRAAGLDRALAARAEAGDPILGICGGYQLLGERIEDGVESRRGAVDGLGLLPVTTRFAADKLLRRPSGFCAWLDTEVGGYEIRHGRVARHGSEPLIGDDEGCRAGSVIGLSWHGALEHDAFRRALLAHVAAVRGRRFVPGTTPFATVREAHLDTLGDLVAGHVDVARLAELIEGGPPADLPVVEMKELACSAS